MLNAFKSLFRPNKEPFTNPQKTFAEDSCKFFGSDKVDGWQCPDSYPVYSGATFGGQGSQYCNGGIAKNAKCGGIEGYGAKAKAYVRNGKLVNVRLLSGGHGYKVPPSVKVIGDGHDALIKCEISHDSVSNLTIIRGGTGYLTAPEIHFETLEIGSGAVAESYIDGDRVIAINVLNTGEGYRSPPTVELHGNGYGAQAVASIEGGRVIEITVISSGNGYSYPPKVVVRAITEDGGCKFCHMCCKKGYKKEPKKRNSQTQKLVNVRTKPSPIPRSPSEYQILLDSQVQLQSQMFKLAQLSSKLLKQPQQPVIINNTSAVDSNAMTASGAELVPKQVRDFHLTPVEREALSDYRKSASKHATIAPVQYNTSGTYRDWTPDSSQQANGSDILEITFPTAIELDKILIEIEQLEPIRVLIYNNGALVKRKRYRNVRNKYLWKDVFSIASKITIEGLENNLSKLEIWGVSAKDCDIYSEKLQHLKTGTRQYLKYQNLYNSCIKQSGNVRAARTASQMQQWQPQLQPQPQQQCPQPQQPGEVLPSQLIPTHQKVADFNKVLDDYQSKVQKQQEEARQKWEAIQKQLKEEQEMAQEAKKYGLPPPPPKHSQKEIQKIKEAMNKSPKLNLSETEKAKCMDMLYQIRQYQDQANTASRQAEFLPKAREDAQKYGQLATSLLDKYQTQCVPNVK